MRVVMLDLASIVPYYTGRLSAALSECSDVSLSLASINYHLDPTFFARQGLRQQSGVLDFVSKLTLGGGPVRRALKTAEYLCNLLLLLVRCTLRPYDIVHVQFLPLTSIGLAWERWILQAIRARGTRIVLTVHNLLPHDTGQSQWQAFRLLYANADHLVCHDYTVKQRLIDEFSADPDCISVIPHGPLFENNQCNAREARQCLSIPADRCLVLWQGIVRPYKGLPFLLEAWQRVQKEGAEATLAIVGPADEAQESEIRKKITELKLENSVLCDLRFLPVEEMALYYSAADLLVYPYSEITTSGALMTGIGFDKAIVATRLPAFEGLLRNEENAMLVSYGDTGELANALRKLIDNPARRAELGQQIRLTKEAASSWSSIAELTRAAYSAVCVKPGSVRTVSDPQSST